MPFDSVDPKQSFPALERGILSYWQEEDIFKRSLRNVLASDTEQSRQKNTSEGFSFYDGPPFATGLPHYGHLLAGTIKDVIPRYQTMQGKLVQRRFGWDCHGLPVEYEVEKEFGLDRDKIKAMGVKAFNDLCRSVVLRYTKEWRNTVERMGRWVDMDWDYRTMDADYMESIWWVFKQLHEKGLIYEGHKPMHICPRCVTVLSNFEVTQGYKDITDQSATVKFELIDKPGTFLLAWTTTPWTLAGNLFLAVHPEVEYVKVKYEGDMYILAKAILETQATFKDKEYEILGESFIGNTLVGQHYKPLFSYFADRYPKAFKVVAGDFVTTQDGTGIVHIAPGFGEDDFQIGKQEGVPLLQHVTMEGRFTKDVTDFAGLEVKPKDDPTKIDQKVIHILKEKNTLFAQVSYSHSYPHCWRCDTPLLNYATSSWFVAVEKIKESMLKANSKTEWVPAHIRDGRFGKWLENSCDWAISRSRYWGTPLPLWKNDETGEIVSLGSRDELIAKQPERFTKITVLRHGQSEGNLIPIYQGKVPGTNLTELGKEQASKSALFLKDKNVHFLYASPLARTQQTAQAVADATGISIITEERIREIGFGDYEGTTIDFTDLSFVKERRAFRMEQNQIETIYHMPGMESFEEAKLRITPFIEELLSKHKGHHVVVVTHADIVMQCKHYFTQEDPYKLYGQPDPSYATPYSFYWDHQADAPLDLHKETTDGISWVTNTEVELTVVRHGETDWNAEGRICGQMDRKLTERGREQARALAQTLEHGTYDVLLCSSLDRALETAKILGNSISLKAESDSIFSEQNFGTYEGKTFAEIATIDPAFSSALQQNILDMPGGEKAQEFLDRAKHGIQNIREKYKGKRVLLVTHSRYINALKRVQQGTCVYTFFPNCHKETLLLGPTFKRIPDVLDCWFESGSMPYAQSHYPFSFTAQPDGNPPGFPADFIAEGIDQTRGWFYTLTVLGAALFDQPTFEHCVVNGTVLAEDGKKMSKRLKNYPEPLAIVEKHGADAVRFALMQSPAVRGEDMRFSERIVEEALRNILLPLWNTYAFFVTYANTANWQPQTTRHISNHPLDVWLRAEVQGLVNRMTKQLESYDLSATCSELLSTIDGITNWYVRLSRRRFAGKSGLQDAEAVTGDSKTSEDQQAALATLHDALLTLSQLLAPFCPFIAETIYLNLSKEEHGSVHLSRWPSSRKLTVQEDLLLKKTDVMRLAVSLGLAVRSHATIKVRQPLAKAIIAIPEDIVSANTLTEEDHQLLRDELNVKSLEFISDPGSLALPIAQVDARKVGPRLGKKVQEIIQAGKSGAFTQTKNGMITILGEELTPEEATIIYKTHDDRLDTAGDHGIVVQLDTAITEELTLEGDARDLIRGIQKLRKEEGFMMGESVLVRIQGADDVLATFGELIERETQATLGMANGDAHNMDLDTRKVTVTMVRR